MAENWKFSTMIFWRFKNHMDMYGHIVEVMIVVWLMFCGGM